MADCVHTNCCLLPCLRPQEHKRLIMGLYPRKNADGSRTTGQEMDLKPADCSRFTGYATRYPEKLDCVGTFLRQKVQDEVRAGREGYVRVLMIALDKLVEECGTDRSKLDVLEGDVIALVSLLLGHESSAMRCVAADTLRCCITAQDERCADYVGKFRLFVSPLLSLCDSSADNSCAVAGFRALRSLIPVLLVSPEHMASAVRCMLAAMLRSPSPPPACNAGGGSALAGHVRSSINEGECEDEEEDDNGDEDEEEDDEEDDDESTRTNRQVRALLDREPKPEPKTAFGKV